MRQISLFYQPTVKFFYNLSKVIDFFVSIRYAIYIKDKAEQFMKEQIQQVNNNERKFGLDLTSLKYIAIVAMVLDHTAYFFLPTGTGLYSVMRFVGRTTGPIMFYAAVLGYHHTKNIHRYLSRLFAFALVSYVPFVLAGALKVAEVDYLYFNVIFTIFMGVLGLHARHSIQNPVLKWAAVAVIGLATLTSDWGITGYLMILVFDFYRGDFGKQAFAYTLIVLLNIGLLAQVQYPLEDLAYGRETYVDRYYIYSLIIKLGHFLPILLLSQYRGEKGKGGSFTKWFFYVFYPLHIGIIYLVKMWMENR